MVPFSSALLTTHFESAWRWPRPLERALYEGWRGAWSGKTVNVLPTVQPSRPSARGRGLRKTSLNRAHNNKMASSHSLLRLLEADLRALSEVRDAKKYPEVKESSERALLKLRSIAKSLRANASAVEQANAVAGTDDMLVPFMHAIAQSRTRCRSRRSVPSSA